jgi:hypothetical protein
LGVAASAAAGSLEGELRASGALSDAAEKDSAEGTYAPYWEEWNGFLEPKPGDPNPARELAVVLRGSASEDPKGCGYTLRGGDLMPKTVVVKTGSTLRIENRDGCSHALYAEGLKSFAPIQTAPGNARTVSISQEGSWPIRDQLYPHVRGHLHALPDLVACGSVDEDGDYEFEDVPAGEYKLSVYHRGKKLVTKSVELDGGDDTLDPIALSDSSG